MAEIKVKATCPFCHSEHFESETVEMEKGYINTCADCGQKSLNKKKDGNQVADVSEEATGKEVKEEVKEEKKTKKK